MEEKIGRNCEYLGEEKPQLNVLYGKEIIFNKQKD